MQRLQQGRGVCPSANEAVVKEYLAALAKLGRLERTNIASLARKAGGGGAEANAGASAGVVAGGGGIGGLGALGTEREPIQVVMAEPGLKSQI